MIDMKDSQDKTQQVRCHVLFMTFSPPRLAVLDSSDFSVESRGSEVSLVVRVS